MTWPTKSATNSERVNSVGPRSLSELSIFQLLVQVGL